MSFRSLSVREGLLIEEGILKYIYHNADITVIINR